MYIYIYHSSTYNNVYNTTIERFDLIGNAANFKVKINFELYIVGQYDVYEYKEYIWIVLFSCITVLCIYLILCGLMFK